MPVPSKQIQEGKESFRRIHSEPVIVLFVDKAKAIGPKGIQSVKYPTTV